MNELGQQIKHLLIGRSDLKEIHAEVVRLGGSAVMKLDGRLVAASLPRGIEPSDLFNAEPLDLHSLSDPERSTAGAWKAAERPALSPQSDPPRFVPDKQALQRNLAAGLPYLLGSVGIRVVLVGGDQPLRRIDRLTEQHTVSAIYAGMDALGKMARLHGIYDFDLLATSQRVDVRVQNLPDPSDFGQGITEEDLERPWRDAALEQLGHPASAEGVQSLLLEVKEELETDWASIAFLTRFDLPPGTAGYYRPDSGLIVQKIQNNSMALTFVHELCHRFGAADEGLGPFGTVRCDCNQTFGVLEAPNGNCIYCHGPQTECVMNRPGGGWRICPHTALHLGWHPSVADLHRRRTGAGRNRELTSRVPALAHSALQLEDPPTG